MSETPPDPEHDPAVTPTPIPGDFVAESKLAARRPHVQRLRAVRTGETAAAVYVGWPESTGATPDAPALYAHALAVAEATGRVDHLLETVPLDVTVHLHAPELTAPGQAVEVLMDLSDLPTVTMEMHFHDLEPTAETLDWFLDAFVSASWSLADEAAR